MQEHASVAGTSESSLIPGCGEAAGQHILLADAEARPGGALPQPQAVSPQPQAVSQAAPTTLSPAGAQGSSCLKPGPALVSEVSARALQARPGAQLGRSSPICTAFLVPLRQLSCTHHRVWCICSLAAR